MISRKMKRAGIALSAVWLLVGGYIAYLNSSDQEWWSSVDRICAQADAATCARVTSDAELYAPTNWGMIGLVLAAGLLALWGGLFALAWVNNAAPKE